MRQKLLICILCHFILLLFITCCVSNRNHAEKSEINNETVIRKENVTNRSIINNNALLDSSITKVDITHPFDIFEFVSQLNNGMEVYRVYPDPNIEDWIELPGKTIAGRYYFNYITPLSSKQISSSDETMAMVNQQARIARHINPGYILNMDIDIRSADSKELEKKNLTLKIQHGTRIQDYRHVGKIKYILKDDNGAFKYGAYIVSSAIITQNIEEAAIFNTFQEWMDKADRSDVTDLFEKIFKK